MNRKLEICPCCMEKHEVEIINTIDKTLFKGVSVEYEAQYHYCKLADELFADEKQIAANDIAMKNAYREKTGLLKSTQISDIRNKYDISQTDLCILLGWGLKTITRYESHQVQDAAHDTILRKLDNDPEWFLELLNVSKGSISDSTYSKCKAAGTVLFERNHDNYLKSAILSQYARYVDDTDSNGNKELSLDVVVDMIRYYANSEKVTGLYLVKLLKMLWYADALSYKRYGHAISGLVYKSLPMGAVPVAYESIIDLSSINIETVDFGNGYGQKFVKTKEKNYPNLSRKDKEILDVISNKFGKYSKDQIIESMHKEDSYTKTPKQSIILYKYASTLSIN